MENKSTPSFQTPEGAKFKTLNGNSFSTVYMPIRFQVSCENFNELNNARLSNQDLCILWKGRQIASVMDNVSEGTCLKILNILTYNYDDAECNIAKTMVDLREFLEMTPEQANHIDHILSLKW